MRKMIVSTYMTLNGVIDNPMWTFPYWGDDIAAFQQADLFAADALLLGRETYDSFAEVWPTRAGTDEFADHINAMQKYVATTTLTEATWNNTSILKGDALQEIAKLKQQPGKNILKYGGGPLLAALIEHNLLDELRVLVYPLTVGSGVRLLPDGVEAKLKLIETKTFQSGVVALIYAAAPAEEVEAE